MDKRKPWIEWHKELIREFEKVNGSKIVNPALYAEYWYEGKSPKEALECHLQRGKNGRKN
jgi:hypothetical protein